MLRGRWLTDNTTSGTHCVSLRIPDGEYNAAAFRGAVFALARAFNWEVFGTSTPDESAAAWDAAFESMQEGGCMPVGAVTMYAGAVLPAYHLWCDGATYNEGDYPTLFAAIGTTYGTGGAGTFNVPDLRCRIPLAAGPSHDGLSTRSEGQTGGQERVGLTINEMPAHSHEIAMWLAFAQLGAGSTVFVPSATSFWATQTRGGSASHENMPPFLVLNAIIKAE
jgi:microcystin-dependent protein